MSGPERRQPPPLRARERALLWLTGILLGLGSGLLSIWMDLSRAEHEFSNEASLVQAELSRRIGTLEVVLTGLVGLFQASDVVSYVQLSTLSEEMLRSYPHIRSIISLQRVAADERAQLEQAMQENGYLQFRITEFGEQEQLVTATPRSRYFPIVLIDPLAPQNGRLLGYDASSDPRLATVIDQAIRTGKVAASPPLRLVRGPAGILVFKARYQGRYSPGTTAGRVAMVDGAIAVELDPERLLQDLVSASSRTEIALHQGDAARDPSAQEAGLAGDAVDGTSALPVFRYRRTLDVYGQPVALLVSQQAKPEDISIGWLAMALSSPILVMLAVGLAWRNLRIRQLREREIEETIRDDERRFRNVVETAFDAVVITDEHGRIVTWNRQAETLFGWRSDEAIGKSKLAEIFPDKTCVECQGEPSGRRPQEPAREYLETIAHDRNGTTFPVEIAISETRSGETYQKSVFIRDIRARKAQEAGLQQAKAAAEAGSRAKSEFLATMSHEIRTPMNGVLGMTELLLRSRLDAQQRYYAETAHRSGQALLDLINNILDFSKIEANKLQLARSPFDLHETVESVLQMVAEQAREKHLELLADIPAELDVHLVGDGPRLRQVLLNLVGNAVKFTERGEILIRVRVLEGDGDEIRVSFEVQDSGIGIDTEKLACIFDPFTQADSSSSRRFDGTGLGLAISRQLVALMGGEIGVESEQGGGSTFRFSARFAKQRANGTRPTASLEAYAGSKVLVVDDNLATRVLLLKKLEEWGLQADGAAAGDEGLGLLREAAAVGKPYALAILDRMMPGMDGITLARRIKADPDLADVRLLMYSAMHAESGDAPWRDAGIEAYLSKPARLQDLRDQLSRLLAAKPPEAATEPTPATPPSATASGVLVGKRVLVVEDNPVNQAVALGMLALFGCRAEVAENGRAALTYLQTNPCDLILMDCHMPEMDGFAATSAIRGQARTDRQIPIIALTADVQKGVRERCHASGMNDCLSKPFSQETLRRVLEKWLSTPPTGTDALLCPSGSDRPCTNEYEKSPVDPRALDRLRALQRPGTPDVLGRVIQLYLDSAPALIDEIVRAVAAGDAEGLRAAAHGLKSSSANLGGMPLSAICERLEILGRHDRLAEAPRLADDLKREYRRVEQLLAAAAGTTSDAPD
ncbi:MAG: response regulator [Rhodocyclaceae bacterium]|nr:response regulator [Rhodocyclaceae bacterium]